MKKSIQRSGMKNKKKLYVPTVIEVAVLSVASALALTAFVVLGRISSRYSHYISVVAHWLVVGLHWTIDRLSSQRFAGVTSLAVWMIIGVVIYATLWSAINYLRITHDELNPVHGMVVPEGYQKSIDSRARLARVILRTIAGFMLVIWLAVVTLVIAPPTFAMFYRGSRSVEHLSTPLLVIPIVVAVVSEFVTIMLMRLIFLRTRIFI